MDTWVCTTYNQEGFLFLYFFNISEHPPSKGTGFMLQISGHTHVWILGNTAIKQH